MIQGDARSIHGQGYVEGGCVQGDPKGACSPRGC